MSFVRQVLGVKEAAASSGGFIDHLCALHSVGKTLESQMDLTLQEFPAQWEWNMEAHAT